MKNKKPVKVGDTVELVFTNDEMTSLKPGDQGTVVEIEGEPGDQLIWVVWKKTGNKFALLEEIDKFNVISP